MKIGFAGIGIMGAPMALNLIRAGHELHVYSRSGKRCETLIAEGAVREDSPAAAASACDVFISIVSDTPYVQEVLFGDRGAAQMLRPDTVAIDMSTISPRATAEFAERLGRKQVPLLDAPVSGGEKGLPLTRRCRLWWAVSAKPSIGDSLCFRPSGKRLSTLGRAAPVRRRS